VSLAATIATLPLSLYYFHQFPGLFFVSNILIVPFVGVIMSIGVVVVILANLGFLPELLLNVYASILSLLNSLVRWFASQEHFLFTDISFSLPLLLVSYFFIISGYRLWDRQYVWRKYLFLIALISTQVVFIVEKIEAINSHELIVFHKTRDTIIGLRQGTNLLLLDTANQEGEIYTSAITDYVRHERIKKLIKVQKIPNRLSFTNKTILIIDSLGVYKNLDIQPDIVMIVQSPKINFERLLKELKPKTIVADGSNYKSFVRQWSKVCAQYQVDFKYTGKGYAVGGLNR
jgi:competence protein ComEC